VWLLGQDDQELVDPYPEQTQKDCYPDGEYRAGPYPEQTQKDCFPDGEYRVLPELGYRVPQFLRAPLVELEQRASQELARGLVLAAEQRVSSAQASSLPRQVQRLLRQKRL